MDAYGGIMLIFSVLFIVIQILLINYLLRLERIGCKCAMDWRRSFMLFYMILVLVHVVAITFITKETTPILQTLFAVMGITNVIITLQYVNKLKREKCECSDSIYKDVITLVAIFNAILYFMLLVIFLYMMFSLSMFAKSKDGPTAAAAAKSKSVSVRPIFTDKTKPSSPKTGRRGPSPPPTGRRGPSPKPTPGRRPRT